ncbi:hypothetical protein SCUP515_02861 [Seiridium cupressi]
MATHHDLFTCTFCYHLARGPPRVLGRSIRLACESCYNSVLDLAACWVCSEVVYRGEERIVRGPLLKEVFSDGEDERSENAMREGSYAVSGTGRKAKEIDTIPLCANCVVDTEDDKQSTVERGDAVLNRVSPGKVHRAAGRITRGAEGLAAHQLPCTSRLATDGVADDGEYSSCCVIPLDSTIYVNISDPVSLPAFKPSSTKPIPRWMQPPWMNTLPNQHQPSRAVNPRPRSILDNYFSDVVSESAEDASLSCPTTICPTAMQTPTQVLPPHEHRMVGRAEEHTTHQSASNDLGNFKHPPVVVARGRAISFVTSEPLKRPSSRLISQNLADISSPTPDDIARSKPASPYPAPPRSTSGVHLNPSRPRSAAQISDTLKDIQKTPRLSPQKRHSSPVSDIMTQIKSKMRRTPPPQSKEYLDLYRPAHASSKAANTATTSIAVAGRARVRRIGNWNRQQPVVEISRRDSGSRPSAETGHADARQVQAPRGMDAETAVNTRGGLEISSAHGDLWKFLRRGRGCGK